MDDRKAMIAIISSTSVNPACLPFALLFKVMRAVVLHPRCDRPLGKKRRARAIVECSSCASSKKKSPSCEGLLCRFDLEGSPGR